MLYTTKDKTVPQAELIDLTRKVFTTQEKDEFLEELLPITIQNVLSGKSE